MKITNKLLKEKDACSEGVKWFDNNKPFNSDIECIKALMADPNAVDENGILQNLNWSNWVICRILDNKQKIKYSVFAAEQVLNIFEKKYPEDKRPRETIEAAKKVLKYNSSKNRSAAYADAAAAAFASAFAADADDAAAASAASAAASYAAATATADASYAKKKEMQTNILNFGLSLLN